MGKLEKVSCPGCGRDMEKGYIFSPRQIGWTKDSKSRIAPGFSYYETLVGSPIFKVKKEVAYRCKECKIALFEYD